jgi:hypothetical protein
MIRGSIDANLGGNVYKQRLARQGQGKSGGFRTIVLIKFGSAAFFVHGFAKKDAANISAEDLHRFRSLARLLLAQTNAELDLAVENGKLVEVHCGKQEVPDKNRRVRS